MGLTLEEYAKLIEENIPDGPDDKEAKLQKLIDEIGENNDKVH
jgi:hypothetical protein